MGACSLAWYSATRIVRPLSAARAAASTTACAALELEYDGTPDGV